MNAPTIVAAVVLVAAGLMAPRAASAPATQPAHVDETARIAYVNTDALVTRHPLAPVLAQYDREIEALQATLHTPGLTRAAQDTAQDGAVVRGEASQAATRVQNDAAAHDAQYRAQERTALAAILARRDSLGGDASVRDRIAQTYRAQASGLQNGARADMQRYRDDLSQQARSSFDAFRAAMALRTQRALAQRTQELRERESLRAYDAQRADAGQRLQLTLKLNELRLDASTRARYRAQLQAIDRRDARAADRLKRSDDAILSAYRDRLETAQAAADDRMALQLASAAKANLAARQAVMQAQTAPQSGISDIGGDTPVPHVAADAAQLAAGYRYGADAKTIEGGFNAAGDDLSQRFSDMAAADRSSQTSTIAQIAKLRSDRDALYHAILADIARVAQRIAAQRHERVVTTNAPPRGARTDLTTAVADALAHRYV